MRDIAVARFLILIITTVFHQQVQQQVKETSSELPLTSSSTSPLDSSSLLFDDSAMFTGGAEGSRAKGELKNTKRSISQLYALLCSLFYYYILIRYLTRVNI